MIARPDPIDLSPKIAIIYPVERSYMKTNTKKITQIVNKYKRKKMGLIAVLQDIQEEYNWLPPDDLKLVAEELCVPLIDVYSFASFYRAFSLAPIGKHICTVCLGTACYVRGAPTVLDRLQERLGIQADCTTKDKQFTLETVNCLGACALAPIIVVDGQYHGQTTAQKVNLILNKYPKKKKIKKILNAHVLAGAFVDEYALAIGSERTH